MDRSKEVRILKETALCVGRLCLAQEIDEDVTGFMAMKGNGYRNELLVYGRAVNGWGAPLAAKALAQEEGAGRFAQAALADAGRSSGECPMLWVTELEGAALDADGALRYNTKKSAFWRTVKQTAGLLQIADIGADTWPSSLVWSNLYKIAPAEGGNPSGRLCGAQQQGCVELFGHELSLFAPKRVLLATGLAWAEPFLEGNGIPFSTGGDSRWIEAYAEMRGSGGQPCRVVVAPHPQGKPEREWVEAVVGRFNA